MPDDIERAARHWDDYIENCSGRRSGLYWYEIPEVLRCINQSISGDPSVDWSEYTIRKYFTTRLPLKRCLSLGSGAGQLERDLAARSAFLQCDAFDVSKVAVERASELAKREGFERIHYSVADINQIALSKKAYDLVWVYGAMHHFQALEHVTREIAQSLVPGGLLAMNEYVGPARFQFPDTQKEIANLCLHLLPRRYRRVCPEEAPKPRQGQVEEADAAPIVATHRLRSVLNRFLRGGGKNQAPDGGVEQPQPVPERPYRESVGFPSAEQVIASDPSEALRSDEILEVLQRDFEIVEKIEWGGNIVQFVLAGIACNFSDDDPASVELIKLLFQTEKVLLKCGELKSDFAYVVARPK